jgi:hypothetical protein
VTFEVNTRTTNLPAILIRQFEVDGNCTGARRLRRYLVLNCDVRWFRSLLTSDHEHEQEKQQ